MNCCVHIYNILQLIVVFFFFWVCVDSDMCNVAVLFCNSHTSGLCYRKSPLMIFGNAIGVCILEGLSFDCD